MAVFRYLILPTTQHRFVLDLTGFNASMVNAYFFVFTPRETHSVKSEGINYLVGKRWMRLQQNAPGPNPFFFHINFTGWIPRRRSSSEEASRLEVRVPHYWLAERVSRPFYFAARHRSPPHSPPPKYRGGEGGFGEAVVESFIHTSTLWVASSVCSSAIDVKKLHAFVLLACRFREKRTYQTNRMHSCTELRSISW